MSHEDRIGQILLLIGEVRGDINGLVKAMTDRNTSDDAQFTEIYKKLDRVSGKVNFGYGFSSAIGAVIGIVVTVLVGMFKH